MSTLCIEMSNELTKHKCCRSSWKWLVCICCAHIQRQCSFYISKINTHSRPFYAVFRSTTIKFANKISSANSFFLVVSSFIVIASIRQLSVVFNAHRTDLLIRSFVNAPQTIKIVLFVSLGQAKRNKTKCYREDTPTVMISLRID